MRGEINDCFVQVHTCLQFSKVATKQARVGLLELSIGQCVTKRVDGAVQVAEKVTSVEEVRIEHDAFPACLTKRLNDRVDVPLEEEKNRNGSNACAVNEERRTARPQASF